MYCHEHSRTVIHYCVSSVKNGIVIKYADDTTITSIGLIPFDNEEHYRRIVADISEWCADNDLELNMKKTKEIIIDFRKKSTPIVPLQINGADVDIVDAFTFLGLEITDSLDWHQHTNSIISKAQRLYFLRRVRSFKVNQSILLHFYRGIIESILTKGIIVWYGNITVEDKARLQRIINKAPTDIGT